MQRADVIAGLSGQGDRDEAQYEKGVAAGAVVLVNGLGVVHAAEQLRDVVLRDADEGLQDEEDVGDEAELAVLGVKVRFPAGELVVFDHNQAGDEGESAGAVENGVDIGAEFLLLGRVGGL